MEKQRILILDHERITCKVRRMAYEIWERNSGEQELTLIGIERGGKVLADNLAAILRQISPLKVTTLPLGIDKKMPLALSAALPPGTDLHGRAAILVDDVMNSGKTLMYSFQSLLAWDLKKLMVAVLVDREHKSFPIASDIVGHTIATTLQNHIEVETNGDEIAAVYLD